MTHEEMIEAKDRSEANVYLQADALEHLELPLTRQGFEALLVKACMLHNLPVDDLSRQFAIEYIHHLEKDVRTIQIQDMAHVLYRRSVNHVTWVFATEIRDRAKQKQGPTLVPEPDVEH